MRYAVDMASVSHDSCFATGCFMADAAIGIGQDLAMSREEYRHWVMTQPSGRFERVDGVVVAMAPERLSHADRKALVWLALRRAVMEARLPCHVYPDGVIVEVGDSDLEPDVLLRCGDELAGDLIAVPDPLVLVEVLSP